MANWKKSSAGALLLLAALLTIAGLVGCGGERGGAPAKADAVVVTYYYLPL
jgi:ABC-type glycerol-3-phosphate transport system substrate-binding protein